MRVRPPQAPDVAWSRTRTGLVEGARDEHSAPAKGLGLPAGNAESSTLKSSLAVALGRPIRTRGGEGGMVAPALVVKDFPFTSVSDAV